jgi:hypothetical protein
MPAAGRVIPWLVLGFSLMALALGLYEWSQPPFTDEQIKTSLVNTWEVAASTSRVLGFVFLGLGMICVVLARRADSGITRNVAYLAALCCLLTVAIFLRNHVVLTQRAAGLTGQEFGPLFGLF